MDTPQPETSRITNAKKFLTLLKSKMVAGSRRITARDLASRLNITEDTVYGLFNSPRKGHLAPLWLDGNFTRTQSAWVEGLIVYMNFSKSEISEILSSLTSEQVDSIFERGKVYLEENCNDYSEVADVDMELAKNITVTPHDVQVLLAFVKMVAKQVSLLDCIKFILVIKKSN